MTSSSATCQRRFLQTFERYLDAVVDQARDRDECRVRSIRDYVNARRDNVAAYPSFALCLRQLSLPDEVLDSPEIRRMETWANDLILLANV
jgi:hypothetical protein